MLYATHRIDLIVLVTAALSASGIAHADKSTATPKSWEGTWEAVDKGHGGELKCVVKLSEGEKWEAEFTGYCNRQFAYKVKMQGKKDGAKILFKGQADLGEKDGGIYEWSGELTADKFDGKYASAAGKKGAFEMKPAKPAKSKAAK